MTAICTRSNDFGGDAVICNRHACISSTSDELQERSAVNSGYATTITDASVNSDVVDPWVNISNSTIVSLGIVPCHQFILQDFERPHHTEQNS